MASFRRFLCSSAAWTAAPAAALFAANATTARLDAAPATDVAPKQPVEFVGVFLTKDSAAQLKQQYPVKFATTNSSADDALFLVLKYNPSEQEKDAFAPILGASAQLQVQGYVEDDTTQAVLVAATTADGEPLAYDSGAEHAHVLLATAAGDSNGLNAGYANVLLERLRASNQLKFLLENDAAADATEWTGELPTFTSTHFPLYSPFPTTTATLVRVEDASSDKKENKTPVLEGTVCLSSSYDAATGTCVADSNGKPECGFCKFMKAGPCGREFSAWEACLDKSKQSGGDFIELCSAPTLALRDCVDANPDYYAILTEDAPADESGNEASMTM